jgi:hypothetical protein
MKKYSKYLVVPLIIQNLLILPCYAQGGATVGRKEKITLKELALPSEVEGMTKSIGSIYYSPHIKGKVLMPVHIWGSVGRPGLHFIPVGTNLIKGLSLAGGPSTSAKLSNITISKELEGNIERKEFNLTDGGNIDAFKYSLKPGDTVFVEKDNFTADRAYYTSLIGVVATILSSILIFRQVKKN